MRPYARIGFHEATRLRDNMDEEIKRILLDLTEALHRLAEFGEHFLDMVEEENRDEFEE